MEQEKYTKKQLDFCYYYVKYEFNGTKAAIAAGYSKNGAEVRASELLRMSKIRKKISEIAKQVYPMDTTIIETRLAQIANAQIKHFFKATPIRDESNKIVGYAPTLKNFNNIDTTAIKSLSVDKDGKTRIQLYDKIAALNKLDEILRRFDPEDSNSDKYPTLDTLREFTLNQSGVNDRPEQEPRETEGPE